MTFKAIRSQSTFASLCLALSSWVFSRQRGKPAVLLDEAGPNGSTRSGCFSPHRTCRIWVRPRQRLLRPKVVLPVPPGLPGKGMAQHSMLYIGEGYNKMFLVDKGKDHLDVCNRTGQRVRRRMDALERKCSLYPHAIHRRSHTGQEGGLEMYDAPAGTEIHACQPIGLDKVLFIENGLPPHLMVVNIKTNAAEVDHVLPAPSSTDVRSIHPQFRHVRYTAQGTYLVPYLNMGKVVEYDKNFNEVWSYDVTESHGPPFGLRTAIR